MLGYTNQQLEELKAINTITEICQQPTTWQKTLALVKENAKAIKELIGEVITQPDYDIIFTGAGTSEFVGNALYACLNKRYDYKLKSYGTTDIVVDPTAYISPKKATLLISFGRSGSSPESVGAIEAANTVGTKVYHLFITCNREGEMAKWSKDNPRCLALVLAPETCDRGFAMTSSFTNMLLCAYLCLTLESDSSKELSWINDGVTTLLESGCSLIEKLITEFAFKRIVYLGSAMLKGIAQESALKILELSAGKTVTMYETPTGFRHGPKSIIDDDTLLVLYLSDNVHSRKYDLDLLKEMSSQRQGNKILLVTSQPEDELKGLADYYYCFGNEGKIASILLGLEYVVLAQIIAVLKSLALGITPDNPSPSGLVNRVVAGVVIHPYQKGENRG